MKKRFVLTLLAALSTAYGRSIAASTPPSGDIFGLINLRDMQAISTLLRENRDAVLAARTDGGITPLHYAASLDASEAVFRLLDAGVEVDILTEGSLTTPLHWAADKGASDTLRLLIQMGANVNAQARNGYTPLHFVARSQGVNPEIARHLLEAGAGLNTPDARGNTPLHVAAAQGHAEAAAFLIAVGADVGLKNREGRRAADLATDEPTRLAFGIGAAPTRRPTPASVSAPPSATPTPESIDIPSPALTADRITPPPARSDADDTAEILGAGEEFRRLMNDPEAMKHPDGSVFKGDLRDGLYHGFGVLVRTNRERYQGEWRKGLRHGIGTFHYPNGDVYNGEWRQDVPHGTGVFVFASGGTVTGTWRNGSILEAEGQFVGADGSRFAGLWRDHTLISYQLINSPTEQP